MNDKMAAAPKLSDLPEPSLEELLGMNSPTGIKVREVRTYPMTVKTILADSLSMRVVRVSEYVGGEHKVTYETQVLDAKTMDWVSSRRMTKESMLTLLLDAAAQLAHD